MTVGIHRMLDTRVLNAFKKGGSANKIKINPLQRNKNKNIVVIHIALILSPLGLFSEKKKKPFSFGKQMVALLLTL